MRRPAGRARTGKSCDQIFSKKSTILEKSRKQNPPARRSETVVIIFHCFAFKAMEQNLRRGNEQVLKNSQSIDNEIFKLSGSHYAACAFYKKPLKMRGSATKNEITIRNSHSPFRQLAVQRCRRYIQQTGRFSFIAARMVQHFQDMQFFGACQVEGG